LKKREVLFEFTSSEQLVNIVNSLLNNFDHYKNISKKAREYITQSVGASQKIINYLKNDKII